MRSILILILYLTFCSFVQSQSIPWSNTYGGNDDEHVRSIQSTLDGGYVICGSTNSYGASSLDGWLFKTNFQGTLEWERRFEGPNIDQFLSVRNTSDEGYVVFGSTSSFGSGSHDAWIIKTDMFGVEQWSQTYGGSQEDYGYDIQQTGDGGYLLLGSTSSSGSGGSDLWLIKTDSLGTQEWSQTYGGPENETGTGLLATTEGDYILSGYTTSFGNGSNDIWLVKVDSTGLLQWSQTYGGGENESPTSIKETLDGGFLIGGYTASFGGGNYSAWVVRTDSTGDELWSQFYGGEGTDYCSAVLQNPRGGYSLFGSTASEGDGDFDIWFLELDENGAEIRSSTHGGQSNDYARSSILKPDGSYIISGETSSFGAGGADAWLFKMGGVGYESLEFYSDVMPNVENPANLINCGVPIRFKIKIHNNLGHNILTGFCTLSSDDESILITDSLASLNNVFADSSAWTLDEFEIIVTDSIEPGTDIHLSLSIEQQIEPTGPWLSSVSFPIQPLIVHSVFIDDDSNPDSNGDNDQIIEPGESVEVIPLIENVSNLVFSNLFGKLVSSNPNVSVWDSISGGSGYVYNTYRYNVFDNESQPVSPGASQILPEVDFVFDFLGNHSQQLEMGLVISGMQDSIHMKWLSTFLLNESQPVSTESTLNPSEFIVHSAYPNPFNPEVTLRFQLPKPSNVNITVYSINGSQVVSWGTPHASAGYNEVRWNGLDGYGRQVSTGLYIASIQASGEQRMIKMLCIR